MATSLHREERVEDSSEIVQSTSAELAGVICVSHISLAAAAAAVVVEVKETTRLVWWRTLFALKAYEALIMK